MKAALLSLALLLPLAAHAQSPQSVPLRENTPDRGTADGRTTQRDPAPAETGSTSADPNARNRPNARVAPPSAINSGVQVIAPERK